MSLQKIFILAILICLNSCSLEREINLGDNYYLLGDFENSVIAIKTEDNKGVYNDVLLGEIKKYRFDDKFIIVNRIINNNVTQLFKTHPLWESQFGFDSQYWIIDKETKELLGPFEMKIFIDRMKQMDIDLSFKN